MGLAQGRCDGASEGKDSCEEYRHGEADIWKVAWAKGLRCMERRSVLLCIAVGRKAREESSAALRTRPVWIPPKGVHRAPRKIDVKLGHGLRH
jgi:hypothetical protein